MLLSGGGFGSDRSSMWSSDVCDMKACGKNGGGTRICFVNSSYWAGLRGSCSPCRRAIISGHP